LTILTSPLLLSSAISSGFPPSSSVSPHISFPFSLRSQLDVYAKKTSHSPQNRLKPSFIKRNVLLVSITEKVQDISLNQPKIQREKDLVCNLSSLR